MFDTIKYLSRLGPHPGGSKEEKKVADFLVKEMKKFSEDVIFDEFEYIDQKYIPKKSVNVIASFGQKKGKKIIICTNLDTIRDLNKVVDLWEKGVNNVYDVPFVEGANEPNSAIAFLIYFMNRLSETYLDKSIELIGFGAQEEWNSKLKKDYNTKLGRRIKSRMNRLGYLLGSRHYVLSRGIDDIDALIAVDAVGIGTPKIVIRDSFGKNTLEPFLLPNMEKIMIRGFRHKPGKKTVEAIGCDHLPFRIAGVKSTWILASKGELVERNNFGCILNHNNIPNYCTSFDTFENFKKETSLDMLEKNYDLISNAFIDFIRKR